MEPEKPRPAGKRAFRKRDDARACARCFQLMLGVLNATLRINAAHKQGPDPPQERARNPLTRQLLFRNERERAWNSRPYSERIEIASVIGDNHHAASRKLTFPLDPQWCTCRTKETPYRAANEAMAPLLPREKRDYRPRQRGHGNEQSPPVDSVDHFSEPTPNAPQAVAEAAFAFGERLAQSQKDFTLRLLEVLNPAKSDVKTA